VTTQEVKRKLTAILSADVKGYSRLMGADEEGTLRILTTYREVMTTLIQQHNGRVVNAPGDALLAEFESVVDAVKSAVEIQRELAKRNTELPTDRRMEYRIGINLGDVMVDGESIYGDGVNIAARLESLSEAGGICISGTVFDQVKNKLNLGYKYLGEQAVKNIAEPVRVYRVLMEPEAAGKVIVEKRAKPRQWQRATIGLVGILIVVVAAIMIWKFYTPTLKTEITTKEKITAPLPEKPSTLPPSVEVAPKEKVTPPTTEKVTKLASPPPPKMEVASKEKMAFPLPDKPSIAVLPFLNMSGDLQQEYFSDGLTEDIINALSKIPSVFVIAGNSTFTYKGKSVKVQQVAEEMGVKYVLEGSVRREGNRVRITAQLIDAITGHHLFSERYDRELKEIFSLQDEMTMKIMTAMRVKLTHGEQDRMLAKGTKNLEAYLKLLQSREHREIVNKEQQALSRQLAEEAIALDPEYAIAYSAAAAAVGNEVWAGAYKNPKEALQRAIELAQKAIAIDESLGFSHIVLGYLSILANRDYEKGIAEAERAVALEPNSADAYTQLAINLSWAGRTEEAIPLFKKAIRLSPIPPARCLFNMAACYRIIGQYEDAIAIYKKILQKQPDQVLAHLGLAATLMLAGREDEARTQAAELLRIDPKFSLERFAKTLTYKNQAEIDRYIGALRKAGLK
jgi:TolB-like protein/class 3 adenylate cyclase/Flp pilus assembly protein TadD